MSGVPEPLMPDEEFDMGRMENMVQVPVCPACESLAVELYIVFEDGPEERARCERCGWEGFSFELGERWIRANWPPNSIHFEGDGELYPGEYRGR